MVIVDSKVVKSGDFHENTLPVPLSSSLFLLRKIVCLSVNINIPSIQRSGLRSRRNSEENLVLVW